MLGKKDYQEKLFLSFSLSHRIPENNFYRRLKEFLDLRFVREMARPYYGSEGQKTLQANKHQLRDLNTHQKWFKDKEDGALGSQDPRARYLSNKTHYSPADPDARVAVKPGKPRQL